MRQERKAMAEKEEAAEKAGQKAGPDEAPAKRAGILNFEMLNRSTKLSFNDFRKLS